LTARSPVKFAAWDIDRESSYGFTPWGMIKKLKRGLEKMGEEPEEKR
jgi:hypothetical protein